MEIENITIYVVCDELLKLLQIEDDVRSQMSNAEVMAFSIIASRMTNGDHKKARWICKSLRYFPNILSESRLNRRICSIPNEVWLLLFRILGQLFVRHKHTEEYAVDSFPVACCQKSRNDRRRLFTDKSYMGWASSKKQYFCGVKVHMIVTANGSPVEIRIRPASENDVSNLWKMNLELPPGSWLYADGAYNSYDLEDLLLKDQRILLLAKRGKSNSKRKRSPEKESMISSRRQIVEGAFHSITHLLPRALRLRTEKGFMIRLYSAILAYSISFIC